MLAYYELNKQAILNERGPGNIGLRQRRRTLENGACRGVAMASSQAVFSVNICDRDNIPHCFVPCALSMLQGNGHSQGLSLGTGK